MSIFAIERIKRQLRSGFARGNKYRVILPADFLRSFSVGRDVLDILCDSVSIPGRSLSTIDKNAVISTSIPYSVDSAPIEMKFLLTNDWSVWDYFNEWHKSIIEDIDVAVGSGRATPARLNFKDDYQKDFTIEQYNDRGILNKKFIIKNAFPKSISGMELGNKNNDILMVNVSMAYDTFSVSK
jgi:hypothetical protein